jgi:hypothetical protein
MNDGATITRYVGLACVVIALSFVMSVLFPSVYRPGPNVLVVGLLALVFFIRDWRVLLVSILGYFFLLRPTSFFGIELLILSGIALCAYVTGRIVLFSESVFVYGGIVIGGIVLLWMGIGGVWNIISWAFLLEVLYSILVAGILFAIIRWVEKIYL